MGLARAPGGKLKHTIKTFEGWKGRWLGGKSSINIDFDTKETSDPAERVLAISYENERLRGVMFDVTGERSRRVGRVRLRRPDNRTLVAVFPVELLGGDIRSYEWWVNVLVHETGPCETCTDHVPEPGERDITHRL